MPLRKWPLLAAQLALLAGPAAAQTPPPAIPVPPVGTAPPPSQPLNGAAAARPTAAQSPRPAAAPAPATPVAAVPGPAAGPGGAPAVPALASILPTPDPKPVRVAGPDESEIPRAEYKARLVACISYASSCVLRGLTPQDRDYLRYELRGQRFEPVVVADIAEARMRQFSNETSADVIAPKVPENAAAGASRQVTTIENRGDAEGYAIAVTLPHADARAGTPLPRQRRPSRPQAAAPDWW